MSWARYVSKTLLCAYYQWKSSCFSQLGASRGGISIGWEFTEGNFLFFEVDFYGVNPFGEEFSAYLCEWYALGRATIPVGPFPIKCSIFSVPIRSSGLFPLWSYAKKLFPYDPLCPYSLTFFLTHILIWIIPYFELQLCQCKCLIFISF